MKKNKKKLNEGIVLLTSLLPVGGVFGLTPKRKDNFTFKGLPGQFDKDGKKVLDEEGNPIKTEVNETEVTLPGNVELLLGRLSKELAKYNFPRNKLEYLFKRLTDMLDLDKNKFSQFSTKKKQSM